MDIKLTSQALESIQTEALVLPAFEGDDLDPDPLRALDDQLADLFRRLIAEGKFKARLGELEAAHTLGRLPAERVALAGFGKSAELDLKRLSDAVSRVGFRLRQSGLRELTLVLPACTAGAVSVAKVSVEALCQVQDDFTKYKKEPPPTQPLEEATLVGRDGDDQEALQHGITRGLAVAEGLRFARELADEPANVLTPTLLAERAEVMAGEEGLGFRTLDAAQMEELGMEALLAVARGSVEPPKLIILDYPGREGGDTVIFVGKAITFDSGGISLKPRDRMWFMKYDMAGGAAVLGAMKAVARLKPRTRVVALVPSCENMPGGRAIKPGDIVRSLAGLHIEITNTDAEGRLILADALEYAHREYSPKAMLDVATLTGACIVALGHQAIGLMGNSDDVVAQVRAAGERVGERLWPLPLWSEYLEAMRSPHADLRNSGAPGAGAITAGAFLSRFVGDTPWAHLDIAGTAWAEGENDKAKPIKGATGSAVRTLVEWATSE